MNYHCTSFKVIILSSNKTLIVCFKIPLYHYLISLEYYQLHCATKYSLVKISLKKHIFTYPNSNEITTVYTSISNKYNKQTF